MNKNDSHLQFFKTYLENNFNTFINEEQLDEIRQHVTIQSVKKRQKLLHIGDICTQSIFVVKGCLRSYLVDSKKREHVVEFAYENCWIADQDSLIKNVPATFYIEALEDSEIILAERNFNCIVTKIIPCFQWMVFDLLQCSHLQKRLVGQLCSTADERYKNFVKSYPTLINRVPQYMIASYLGIKPQSLSRVRSQLNSN